MPDSNPPPELLRRANRIGLRTLRQRPQVVGRTPDGEHVFEVRSVRLLLGSTSDHFSLSVPCSECGRDVAGPAVQSRTDLDISIPAAICHDCADRARTAAAGSTVITRSQGLVEARRASEAAAPVAAPDSEREAELAALREGLAEARAAVTSLSETTAARLAAMDAQLRLRLTGMETEIGDQGIELARLAESAGTNIAALQQVIASQQELLRSQDDTNRRLAEVAATPPPPPPPDTSALDDLQQRLEATRREVAKAMRVLTSSSEATAQRVTALEGEVPKAARRQARIVETQKAAVDAVAESVAADRTASQAQLVKVRNEMALGQETLAEALAETRREATAHDREVKVAVSDLRSVVAALRSDLEASTQAQLDRLAAEIDRHVALVASVEALAVAVQVGERRTDSLQQRVEDAVALLSERLEEQGAELAKALERELLRFELGLRSGQAGARGPATTGNGRPAGPLVAGLDDQLRAVEERLAQLATHPPT